MHSAQDQVCRIVQTLDLARGRRVASVLGRCAPEAHLTLAPAHVDLAVVGDGACELLSANDFDNVIFAEGRQLLRHAVIGINTREKAQLPVAPKAPHNHIPVLRHHSRMRAAATHRDQYAVIKMQYGHRIAAVQEVVVP